MRAVTAPTSRRPWSDPLTPLLAASVLLVGLLVNRWPGFLSPIEWSHLQGTLALVDRGTFEVSAEVRALGAHPDLSQHGGRIFPNKAPGLTLAAVPAIAAIRLAERVTGRAPSLELLLWSARTLACLVPLVIFLPWFVRERRRRGDAPEPALLAGGLLLIGTPALVYADLLTAQLPAGLCAYVAASSLLDRRFVRAGLFAGLSVLLQYPLALVAVAFAVATPFLPDDRRPAGRLAATVRLAAGALGRLSAGAALPAAFLLAYDTICFGGPFQLSSFHETLPEYQELARSGAAGITAPGAEALLGLLVSPSRGLFFFAPVLLLSAVGLVVLARQASRRAEALLLALGAGVPVVTFAGYENWHGGSSFGPRYLIPVLPFLAALVSALPLPVAPSRRAAAVAGLAGLSLAGFAQTFVGLVSFPNVPFAVGDAGSNAIQNFCLPLLLSAGRAPTWLDGWGLRALALPALLGLGLAVAAAFLALAWRVAPPGLGAMTVALALAASLGATAVLASIGTGENEARDLLRRIYARHMVPWAVVSRER